MKLKVIIGIIIVCVAGMALGAGLSGHVGRFGLNTDTEGVGNDAVVTESTIRLVCVGDIMVHRPQYESAYDATTDTYDFDGNFTYVKEYIEEADVAFCNVETVFGGGEPQGYPMFNAPDELANSLKNAGFDVAFTSNNHMMDQGGDGVLRSLEVLQRAGLQTVGSQLTEEEPDYLIVPTEELNIGVIAYTYETTGESETPTINSIRVPDTMDSRICSFNPAKWETDMVEIQQTIQSARDAGADMIVCYFHWGEEYQPIQDVQRDMATTLVADTGVDVIFASHPHVLQEAEVRWSEAQQKNVPIFYSMGNFVSNQRNETMGNRKAEDGMVAGVTFSITKEDGVISGIQLVKADVLPTWMNRYQKNGKWAYEVVPLDESWEDCPSLRDSGNESRAQQSLSDTKALMGENLSVDEKGRLLLFDASQWQDTAADTSESTTENGEEARPLEPDA